MSTIDSLNNPLSPRTDKIVGRKKEIKDIKKAIKETDTRRVLYFVAEGGIGKTRLLQEVDNLRKRWCVPIIDLYHQKNHSPSGLRRAIVDNLGENRFPEYTKQRIAFEKKRGIGRRGKDLEELRAALDDIFVQEYNRIAARWRIILRFDTLELLQYEHDSVQDTCLVNDVDTVVKNWLLRIIPKLQNTITIFAGRPRPQTEQEFQATYTNAGCLFTRYELPAFSEKESKQYLDLMRQKFPQQLDQILLSNEPPDTFGVSEGKPIRLALIVDLLRYEEPFDTSLPKKQVDKELVERLLHLPDALGLTIQLMLRARKGLDKRLLEHLWGKRNKGINVDKLMQQVSGLAITKTYEGNTARLFLHDELYDLYDRYFLDDPRYRKEFFTPLRDYYQQELDVEIVRKVATEEEMKAQADRVEVLKLALLYYALQCEPGTAYIHHYVRWDEEAIKKHESGFDMRLRDEVLRFYNRYAFDNESPFYDEHVDDLVDTARIHRDCAVRWVKRHLARGDFGRANRAAQNVYESQDDLFDWAKVDDSIFKAGLLTAWSEALLYTADVPEQTILDKLDEVLKLLPVGQLTKASFSQETEDDTWLKLQILGKAYNNRGYLHRSSGRYGEAYDDYLSALRFFGQIGLEDERANTLTNLAYLMALLGRVDTAKHHIEEAIRIREKWDKSKRYTIALSRNTDGLIDTYGGRPELGIRKCRTALAICEEVEEPRGIGMAYNALGFALRRRGEQWKLDPLYYEPEEPTSYFIEAEETLQKAIKIFTESVNEPIRLWEAYNELGSLFCDWAFLTYQNKADWPVAIKQYEKSIKYQEDALAIAEENDLSFQITDSYDDLAQTKRDYSYLLYQMKQDKKADGIRREAEAHLDLIEYDLISSEYQLSKRGSENLTQSTSGKQVRGVAYWQSLGKVYLQRGIWELHQLEGKQLQSDEKEEVLRQSIEYLAIASAYFQQFWPQSANFQNTLQALTKRLGTRQIPAQLAREAVQKVEEEYRLDLSILKKTIDDTLGI